ncbi:hypothetical protein [Eubacterium xylanophilum]|uniref:hypothetical protein n=1 Tax=Eubacterium xylanophilum TaxID=39497 RepID=UPI00047AF30D|nr:hypothetical protein [Eubacterium xylanophilum]
MAKRTYILRIVKKMIPIMVLALLGIIILFAKEKSVIDNMYRTLYDVIIGNTSPTDTNEISFSSYFLDVVVSVFKYYGFIGYVFCVALVFFISFRDNSRTVRIFMDIIPIKSSYKKFSKYLLGEAVIVIIMGLIGLMGTIYLNFIDGKYSDMTQATLLNVPSLGRSLEVFWMLIAYYFVLYSIAYTAVFIVSLVSCNELVWGVVSLGCLMTPYAISLIVRTEYLPDVFPNNNHDYFVQEIYNNYMLVYVAFLVVLVLITALLSLNNITHRENAKSIFSKSYVGSFVFTGIIFCFMICFERVGLSVILGIEGIEKCAIVAAITALVLNVLRMILVNVRGAKKNEKV